MDTVTWQTGWGRVKDVAHAVRDGRALCGAPIHGRLWQALFPLVVGRCKKCEKIYAKEKP